MTRKRTLTDASPPADGTGRGRKRWMGFAGWTALLTFSILTGFFTLRSAPTTFRLSAQTEEIRIYTARDTATSALPFDRALLADGDTRIPMDGKSVQLSRGVTIRLHRVLVDTLSIVLEADSSARSAGIVYQHERPVGTLPRIARFHVPLSGNGTGAGFQYSFHAIRIEVGNVMGNVTGPRTPLLRSGQLALSARTLMGRAFDASTYDLRLGQRVDLPSPGSKAAGVGAGLVLVDGGPGMNVEFTIGARSALVSSDGSEDKLAAGVLERVTNDQWLSLAWVLVVTLVLSPVGSVIADRMKRRAERMLEQ